MKDDRDGAARIGKVAKEIVDRDFKKAIFYLHGSFGENYKQYGTDKALLVGIIGIDPTDENLKNSFKIAKKEGIEFEFIEADLGYHHPNTVKIVFEYNDSEDMYIVGSSIGEGNILITDIDGNKIEFTGDYPTLLLKYKDQKGVISRISSILSAKEINIATMKVTREKNIATMVVEADSNIDETIINEIDTLDEIMHIRCINPIER